MRVGPALLASELEADDGLLVLGGDAAVEGTAVEGAAGDVPFPEALSSAWITESSAPSRRNSVAASAVI
jgi:hypothetical protein